LAGFADPDQMNGTRTLRIAGVIACTAALVAPGSALAKKHHVQKAKAPAVTVLVPHDYDAGGNGAGSLAPTPGVRVNLFDPTQVAIGLGNQVLAELGLPPVTLPALPAL
jgi:hypothetical protein